VKRRGFLALGGVLAIGCSDEDDPPKGGLVFRPDAAENGATLSLRASSLQDGRAVFTLVGAELDDIYGLAFRLAYDAQGLHFRELVGGSGWGAAPDLRVLGRESRPGLLVAALTRVGKQPGVGGRDAALAEISFELAERKPSRLDFVAPYSRVFAAKDGRKISARFVGGAIERR
jgi:hypothetical protein